MPRAYRGATGGVAESSRSPHPLVVRWLLPCRRFKPSRSRYLLLPTAVGCGLPSLTEVLAANVDRVTALSVRSQEMGRQSGNGVCAACSQRYDF